MANSSLTVQTIPAKLPTFTEYQEALQNPKVCFQDDSLRNSTVDSNPFDIPRVISGGFALTYRLTNNHNSIALRCFHKPVPDRRGRQEAISKYIKSHPSNILIPTHYLDKGIRIGGKWYPVNYMQWVEGDTLSTYLVKHNQNRKKVESLSNEFRIVVGELERIGIAHGDLSAANIMVLNEKMVLIDYDGMYVPTLDGRASNELGNIYFQHPGRKPSHYNKNIDRFSAIVIFLALKSLSQQPSLWKKYESSDGILFRRDDFINPDTSTLLRQIEALDGLQIFVKQFRQICKTDFDHVPSFSDFLASSPLELPEISRAADIPAIAFQYPVIDGKDEKLLRNNIGERVEVIGKVTHGKQGLTYRQDPYVFLNFGKWPNQTFTVVFWSDALSLFEQVGIDPQSYKGNWVSVTGIIETYDWKSQIIISSPTEIELLEGESAAKERLDTYISFKESSNQHTHVVHKDFPQSQPSDVNHVDSQSSILRRKDIEDKFMEVFKVPQDSRSFQFPPPESTQQSVSNSQRSRDSQVPAKTTPEDKRDTSPTSNDLSSFLTQSTSTRGQVSKRYSRTVGIAHKKPMQRKPYPDVIELIIVLILLIGIIGLIVLYSFYIG